MNCIVDASVAIKWFSVEEMMDEADRLRPFVSKMLAPDLLLIEISNIIWKKVRLREIERDDAARVLPWLRHSGLRLIDSKGLADQALELAMELDHSAHDCFYVAAMDLLSAKMITADRRLHARLAGSRFAGRCHALAEVDALLTDLAAS